MSTTIKNYVCEINAQQSEQLHALLSARGWQFDSIPYAYWRAQYPRVNVVSYESGKLTVQGEGTADFVQFILEPEVLKEARFGYEAELTQIENPEMFKPHAGIDESGKGDFFGPLVIACCYTDESNAKKLLEHGVCDSKSIGSDKKIMALDEKIRQVCNDQFSLVCIGPEAYNRLYDSFANLNRMLAWGHARALENLLEKQPDCPRAISDQFARPDLVRKALLDKAKKIKLEQRVKAESDIAVAAASILARAEFVRRIAALEKTYQVKLPRGAGAPVLAAGREIVKSNREDILPKIAKMHFKTAQQIKS
ncbi:MAG: ribonuclease HIII [Oligosphaeraceae bacterium]|nr:ribonuclease HIII [Oligosphaeraceae bacterium]